MEPFGLEKPYDWITLSPIKLAGRWAGQQKLKVKVKKIYFHLYDSCSWTRFGQFVSMNTNPPRYVSSLFHKLPSHWVGMRACLILAQYLQYAAWRPALQSKHARISLSTIWVLQETQSAVGIGCFLCSDHYKLNLFSTFRLLSTSRELPDNIT